MYGRYGYIPLPKTISRNIFDEYLNNIKSSLSHNDDLNLLNSWYLLDMNNIPPNYILKNLKHMDDNSYWNNALPKLIKMLHNLPFDEEYCNGLFIGRSVTEYEITAAIKREIIVGNMNRLVWYRRLFAGGVIESDIKSWNFNDTITDVQKANHLHNLETYIENSIPNKNIKCYNTASYNTNYINNDEIWQKQLKEWETDITNDLLNDLDKAIDLAESWHIDSCGLGIPGKELEEMLHHCLWANNKIKSFIGRDALVNEVLNRIILNYSYYNNSITTTTTTAAAASTSTDNSQSIDTGVSANDLSDAITLSIIGGSGCGKTALMAVTANLVYKHLHHEYVHSKYVNTECQASSSGDIMAPSQQPLNPTDINLKLPIVIIRFCGTSKDSSTGLALIQSICRQIYLLLDYNMNGSPAMDILSLSYEATVQHFQSLLATYPIILFIDSLDQLSDRDLARSRISFLRGCQLHPSSKVIVSALTDGMYNMY